MARLRETSAILSECSAKRLRHAYGNFVILCTRLHERCDPRLVWPCSPFYAGLLNGRAYVGACLLSFRVNVDFTDTITRTSIYSPGSPANWTLNHRVFLNCQNYFLIQLSSWVSKRLLSKPLDSHFAETGQTLL